MVIENWNPNIKYNKNDLVLFLDKLYVSIKDNNLKVVPIPVIMVSGNNFINRESIDPIVKIYFPVYQNNNLNINSRSWVML